MHIYNLVVADREVLEMRHVGNLGRELLERVEVELEQHQCREVGQARGQHTQLVALRGWVWGLELRI